MSEGVERLSVRRLSSSPGLDGIIPKRVKISPDGALVSFLQGRKENQYCFDLWTLSITSGKREMLVSADQLVNPYVELSDEEKARRERKRVFGNGIMEYFWSPESDAILLPVSGKLFYFSMESKVVSLLPSGDDFVTDPKFSPNGNYVSYIAGQNMYTIKIDRGKTITFSKPIALTKDGGGAIKNGMAEFVAQEEMDRYTGYWWCPSEKSIAYLRVDETNVELVTRNEIYADGNKTVQQRYPYAGKNNVQVRLGIVQVNGKPTSWIDIGKETDIYIPRVNWASETLLSYQWQSRNQKELCLRIVQTDNLNVSRTVVVEKSDKWLNVTYDLCFISDGQGFVWGSERSGYNHLYLYSLDGELKRQLTDGEWVVNGIERVDRQLGFVYFTGTKDTCLETHLYRVSLEGGPIERVSKRAGCHAVSFGGSDSLYLDTFSSLLQPPQVSLHDANGEHLLWIAENKVDSTHPLHPYFGLYQAPEFGTLKAEDGQDLHYRLFKPTEFDESKKYPVIVRVYGGPHAQTVLNTWRGSDHFTQLLLQQGFIVFQLDNRGSANRGVKFEQVIYGLLGDAEVADQKAGVKYLSSLPYVDSQNVGIYGHSYGGYMTLMCLFKASDCFKAGVSGAPVTEWRLYDTYYTERYLMHPDDNDTGYTKSSVFPYVKGYKNGSLFIYHGMADDNVLFENSTRVYKALQDQCKLFEMMDYPGSKHSMNGANVGRHMQTYILDFFTRKLKT